MKNISLLFASIIVLSIYSSCRDNAKSLEDNSYTNNVTSSLSESPEFDKAGYKMALEYVNNNKYIALDSSKNKLRSSIDIEKDENLLESVASYRFYSKVFFEDYKYTLDPLIKSGKDINISEALFSSLKNEIEDLNLQIKEYIEEGNDPNNLILFIPNKESLDLSLINNFKIKNQSL